MRNSSGLDPAMATTSLLSRLDLPPKPAMDTPAGSESRTEFVQGSSRPPRQRKRKRAEDEGPPPEVPTEKQPLLTPWLESMGVAVYESKEKRLHDEIVAFAGYILPTPQETLARTTVIKRIENVLLRRFRDGKVHVYGSVSTGLCLPTGDIDIVVTTPQVQSIDSKKSALFQLRSMLQRDGVAADVQVNAYARVPVLNMVTSYETGSFNTDITINGEEGVQAIGIVKDYLASMPALRPLLLVVKSLLEMHNLHSAATGGLSSYAATCMLISFLQLNPTKRPSDFIDNPVQNEAFGHLLSDFLKYYAEDFPYATSAVSVTEKALVSKKEKGWEKAAFAVQCLVYPENNIAKGTGKVRQLRELFKESGAALESADLEKTKNNILGTILRLPQETIDYRARISRPVSKRDERRAPPKDDRDRTYHQQSYRPAASRGPRDESWRDDRSYYPSSRQSSSYHYDSHSSNSKRSRYS